MTQQDSHHGGDDADRARGAGGSGTDVPRAVRAALRLVALYLITTGAVAFAVFAAIALGVFDPTSLFDRTAPAEVHAQVGQDLARMARFPMIGGALSVGLGVALYATSPRIAAAVAR